MKFHLTRKNDTVIRYLFISAMVFLFIIFIYKFILCPEGSAGEVFFLRGSNFMADFHNVVRYAKDRNPYWYGLIDSNNMEHAYFPLSYLLLYPFSRFAATHIADANSGINNFQEQINALIFTTFSVLIFFSSLVTLSSSENSEEKHPFAIVFPLFLSGIMLFSIERGNLIILTVAFCTFFLAEYRSKSAIMRELSYIALALAAALKGYPALLGILLLYDKQWFRAMRLVIYGIIATIVPFFCFKGGLANISLLIENVKANGDYYGTISYHRFSFRFFTTTSILSNGVNDVLNQIMPTIDLLIAIILILSVPFMKQNWQKILNLMLVIVMIPTNSAEYCGLYLFPVIISFLSQKDHKRTDYFYLLLFLIILNPAQKAIDITNQYGTTHLNVTFALVNIATYILYIVMAIIGIISIVKYVISKTKKTNEKPISSEAHA